MARVLGQSGKIEMTLDTQANVYGTITNITEVVKVTMEGIQELDSDFNPVKNTGPPSEKHSFNTFATMDFTFSNVVATTFQNLDVSMITFNCPLINNVVNLKVLLYIFLEPGEIAILCIAHCSVLLFFSLY